MYTYQGSAAGEGEAASSAATRSRDNAAYVNAHEELFGPVGGRVKGTIVAHPLFEQLLAAHVACLRVATPQEHQHIIDSALHNRHHVAAKYLALLTHLQNASLHPAENDQELTHFMVNYILLLQSFKEKLHHHLRTQASEAISACQDIEQALFNLTGVASSTSGWSRDNISSTMTQEETADINDDGYFEQDGTARLDVTAFLPCDIQKSLRDHVRRELKHELKEDYQSKLKEVRDEILRKRRAGKLPEDTTHLLRDWWISHAKWPYPTEEEKTQLMEETGLELKQINNWFINQRKRNWQAETNTYAGTSMDTMSNSISMTLSLNVDKEDILQE